MADQTTSNREIVEEQALAIVFSTEKSQPLLASAVASAAGTISYSTIRKAIKASNPNLSGDALTTRVNAEMNAVNSTTLAAVIQLNREGFNFTRCNGRQLKNGTKNVSLGMTNRSDTAAKPAKKISDYSVAELEELVAAKKALASAKTIDV